jgi:hypothetical protein
MPLSWNEIRDRAVHFSREWSQEAAERAGAQTFWKEFFEAFGISGRRVAAFEAPVKQRRDGGKTANSVIDQEPEAFPSGSCSVVPGASLSHCGVLISTVHMAWMRCTCGRMKSVHQCSNSLVDNNYPWPDAPSDKQRCAIEAGYGFKGKTDAERVAFLFQRYQALTSLLPAEAGRPKRRARKPVSS